MAKKNLTPPKSFEDALRELDQILADIESGEVGLEENLVKYERGTFLIQHCRTVLRQAEQQIEMLSKAPDGGLESSPMVTPEDPSRRQKLEAGEMPADDEATEGKDEAGE